MTEQANSSFPFLSELHIFPHQEAHLVFHPESFSLFRVGTPFAELLRECRSCGDSRRAAARRRVRWSDLESRLAEMDRKIARGRKDADPTAYDGGPDRVVGLTLHVSNACNLGCLYCYAQGGDYGRKPQRKMDKDLARRAIDCMYRSFPNLGNVMFFGGEPLLALDVIEEVCSHIRGKRERGEIARLPKYKMVSNGTLVNDEVVRVIREHEIQVTLSVDGPREINDRLRPYKNGKGSYDAVKRGFNRITQETGQVPFVEATYTRLHLDNGMSMKSLIDFLREEFLFNLGTVAEVSVAEDHPLAVPRAAAKEEIGGAMDNLAMAMARGDVPKMERSFLFPFLYFVRKKGARFTCSVAHDAFDVTADGEIYPCQLFIGREEFRLGTVDDFDYHARSPQMERSLDRLVFADKQRNPICRDCWARAFCFNCPGAEMFAENDYQVPESFCHNMQEWLERVLTRLYEIKSDPRLWSTFLAGLQVLARELEERGPETAMPVPDSREASVLQALAPAYGTREKLYSIGDKRQT